MLKVIKYSHFFKAEVHNELEKRACIQYTYSLIQWGVEKRGRNYVRVPYKVFAASNKQRTEYRFHITQLEDFLVHAKSRLLEIEVVEHPFKPKIPIEIDIKVKPEWKPRDYQVDVLNYLNDKTIKPNHLVTLATGQGKALTLDSLVKIPGGWATMGSMKVGDEVITRLGTVTKVKGVYPQGIRPCYALETEDGRISKCDEDHLWEVYSEDENIHGEEDTIGRYWTIKTTKQLVESGDVTRFRLPVSKPEEIPDVELPLHPYCVGVLFAEGYLGNKVDGSDNENALITSRGNDNILQHFYGNLDKEYLSIANDLKPDLWAPFQFSIIRRLDRATLIDIYQSLGFWDKAGKRMPPWEVKLPEDYLTASPRQKRALLKGIIDIAGCADTMFHNNDISSSFSIKTLSETAAKQIRSLVWSLGGTAKLTTETNRFKRIVYLINIDIDNLGDYTTNEHLIDWVKSNKKNDLVTGPSIKSIKPIANVNTQCITLEDPEGLFITDDYLVTHNSYCSMQHTADVGIRTLYLIRPAFIDKWVSDLFATFKDLKPEDVTVVQGSAQLMALLAMASNNEEMSKIIILSNKTYQNYLKAYDEFGVELLDQGFDCLPEDMYEHLGVGIRYIDEVHLDFHLNFKADLYTNIPQAAAFSASLIDSNPFMRKMYSIAYPNIMRFKAPPAKRYIEARGVLYRLKPDRKPKITWNGRTEYSHGAYENWLVKNKEVLENYFFMIKDIIDGEYIENYKEGDRLLVFCYSIELATRLTQFLSECYPDKTIERYVQDDGYENVMEPDIRVSTVLSAGTGIDIKKLKVAILTTAISSEKSNIQAMGRLRELKDDDRPPVFFWLTCSSIDKHMRYHEKKKELLKMLTKSVGERYYDKPI